MMENNSEGFAAWNDRFILFIFINFRHKGNNERPKILIDLKEFIHVVVQRDNLGQLLGGKYGLWMNYFRKFLKQLKEAHVDLIFFASGKKLTDELMIFIPKREEEYIRYLDVLDSIDGSDGSVNEFFKRKDRDIRGPITLEYNMQRLASELGVLHINYVRHNQEMAKFIKQHDKSVLAVITNDNDFMIFDGKYQFWQANDVNLRELTGIRMCRKLLRARLEMNSQQLQLLSALSGSNYLPMLVLRKFYKRIWGEGVEGNRIPQIAKYIRDEVPLISVSGENCVRFDLKKVARDVFGEDYTEQDLNAIENGLAQYNLNFPSDDAEEGISHAMKSCKSRSMFIYKLCTDDVYLVKDICYIDYRNYKSKTYAELIIPLIRKMQGIVFANEPHRPPVRAICMKYAHDEPYKVVEETVDYPPSNFRSLMHFILSTKDLNYYFRGLQWTFRICLFWFSTKIISITITLAGLCLIGYLTLDWILYERLKKHTKNILPFS